MKTAKLTPISDKRATRWRGVQRGACDEAFRPDRRILQNIANAARCHWESKAMLRETAWPPVVFEQHGLHPRHLKRIVRLARGPLADGTASEIPPDSCPPVLHPARPARLRHCSHTSGESENIPPPAS